MYLKKVDGPRSVTLPNGKVLTRADLPPADTKRWVASRKLAVIRAVRFGLLSRDSALQRYGLSDEEYGAWEQAVEQHGEDGLKATKLQDFRNLDV